jgi:hypothetical protein
LVAEVLIWAHLPQHAGRNSITSITLQQVSIYVANFLPLNLWNEAETPLRGYGIGFGHGNQKKKKKKKTPGYFRKVIIMYRSQRNGVLKVVRKSNFVSSGVESVPSKMSTTVVFKDLAPCCTYAVLRG